MSRNLNRTVLRAQTAIRAPGSSQCNLHRGHDVAFVCKDCGGDLLCPQCIKQHTNHSLVSLSEDTDHQTRTEYLQTFINRVEKDTIIKLQTEIQLTKKEKEENSKHFKNLVLKVEKRSEELKSWVEEMKVQYVTTFKEMEDHNCAKLEKYLSELNKNLKLVGDCLQKTKSALQVGGPIQVYDTCTKIKTSDLTLPQVPHLKSADFRENTSSQTFDQLREMIGSFTGKLNITNQVRSGLSLPVSMDDSLTVPTPPATAIPTPYRGAGKRPTQVSGTASPHVAPFMQSIQEQTERRQQSPNVNASRNWLLGHSHPSPVGK